jgi:hypothetical protein
MADIHSAINAYAQELSFFMSLDPEEIDEDEDDLKDKAAKAYAEILIEANAANQDPNLLIYGIIHGMLWQKAADEAYDQDINELQLKLQGIFKEIQEIAFAKYIGLGFQLAG